MSLYYRHWALSKMWRNSSGTVVTESWVSTPSALNSQVNIFSIITVDTINENSDTHAAALCTYYHYSLSHVLTDTLIFFY